MPLTAAIDPHAALCRLADLYLDARSARGPHSREARDAREELEVEFCRPFSPTHLKHSGHYFAMDAATELVVRPLATVEARQGGWDGKREYGVVFGGGSYDRD